MKFVLDCSVTMAWCFEDENNNYVENVLTALQNGHEAEVPLIWKLEVSNVLLMTERKKRITSSIAHNFKNALTFLPIQVEESHSDRIFDTVFELGRELQLTAYDACYIELALRKKLPLATQDTALIKAAKKIHVERFL